MGEFQEREVKSENLLEKQQLNFKNSLKYSNILTPTHDIRFSQESPLNSNLKQVKINKNFSLKDNYKSKTFMNPSRQSQTSFYLNNSEDEDIRREQPSSDSTDTPNEIDIESKAAKLVENAKKKVMPRKTSWKMFEGQFK